jgi:hypothetical protein
LERLLVDAWEAAAVRNDRERLDSARRAAEALFKPKEPGEMPQAAEAAKPDPAPAAAAQPPVTRRPRILAVQAPVRTQPESIASREPAARQRKPAGRPRRRRLPAAQFEHVRTLARYGMTPSQLAELHDVAVDEIDAILGPRDPG